MGEREISFYRPHDSSPLAGRTRARPRRLTIGQLGLREPFGPGLCRRDRGTPNYFLLMLFDSEMRIAFDEELEETPAGTLALWRPEHKHVYGTAGDATVLHSYVFFNGPGIGSLLDRSGLASNNPIAGVSAREFEHGVAELYRELARPDEDERVLSHLLDVLILRAARDARPSRPSQVDPRVARVRHRIDQSFQRTVSLDDLADEAGLSPNYLCALFKEQWGCTPHEHVTRLRMQQAMQLLRDTDQRVLAIAERVGYDDPYYFSRQFKTHVGVSPRQFRNREQGTVGRENAERR